MTEESSLCVRGCGFFSTSQTKNLCSKCYKDFLKDETAKYLAAFTCTETAEEAAAEVKTERKKKKTSRCSACKKKVGLLGFRCRCGYVFCGSHRYPEEHSCPVDYKSAAINDLILHNPIIKGDKLSKL